MELIVHCSFSGLSPARSAWRDITAVPRHSLVLPIPSDPDARLECPGTHGTMGALTQGARHTAAILRRQRAALSLIDQEGELAIIMGRRASHIEPTDAPHHIVG